MELIPNAVINVSLLLKPNCFKLPFLLQNELNFKFDISNMDVVKERIERYREVQFITYIIMYILLCCI